jgi:hypothetical protein
MRIITPTIILSASLSVVVLLQQDGSLVAAGTATATTKRNLRQLESCQSDGECASSSYCASGECLVIGTCAMPVDCDNPSNGKSSCSGHWDCQQDTCVCIEDQRCPNGSDAVYCFMSPCDVPPPCDEAQVLSCVDSYCGDCIAIQFDSAGNHVCSASDDGTSDGGDGNLTPVEGKLCVDDSDCATSSISSSATTRDNKEDQYYYCSEGGTCLMHGSCGIESDCTNPANIYALAQCVGTTVCGANICEIVCCGAGDDCNSNGLDNFSNELNIDNNGVDTDGDGTETETDGTETETETDDGVETTDDELESLAYDKKGLLGWMLLLTATVGFALQN